MKEYECWELGAGKHEECSSCKFCTNGKCLYTGLVTEPLPKLKKPVPVLSQKPKEEKPIKVVVEKETGVKSCLMVLLIIILLPFAFISLTCMGATCISVANASQGQTDVKLIFPAKIKGK